MKVTANWQAIATTIDNARKSGSLPVWAPDWTDDQIRAEFDRDHDMTVKRLAVATMKTPAQIKRILRA